MERRRLDGALRGRGRVDSAAGEVLADVGDAEAARTGADGGGRRTDHCTLTKGDLKGNTKTKEKDSDRLYSCQP